MLAPRLDFEDYHARLIRLLDKHTSRYQLEGSTRLHRSR